MFGDLVVWYLFLGGAGAGMVTVLALADLLFWMHSRHPGRRGLVWAAALTKRFFAQGYSVATIALLVGAACLLLDVQRPDRFYYVLIHPTFSVLTLGSYALTGSILCAGALCAIALFDSPRIPPRAIRALEVCAAIFGLVMMAYTGLFLSEIDFVPLWSSPFLPVLFTLSSLSVGIVCVFGGALLEEGARRDSLLRTMVRADTVLILLEVLCVVAYLATIAWLQGESVAVAHFLLGEGMWLFWTGFVALGIVMPLAAEAAYVRRGAVALAAVVVPCVVIGGYFLRYCIVNVPYL